jgi:hypothetical protein
MRTEWEDCALRGQNKNRAGGDIRTETGKYGSGGKVRLTGAHKNELRNTQIYHIKRENNSTTEC